MRSSRQSDELLDERVEQLRTVFVISAETLGGQQLRTAEAHAKMLAIRFAADQRRIPVVVQLLEIDTTPDHAHVAVYHMPDAVSKADSAVDGWHNQGGSQPIPAQFPRLSR